MTPTFTSTRRRRFTVAALLATTLLTGGGLLATEARSQNDAQPVPLTAPAVSPPAGLPHAGFADLAAKVKPAVVNIAMTEGVERTAADAPDSAQQGQLFRRGPQARPRGGRQGVGSGFIIDPAGWIVTNNHVVDHAREVTVTLDDGSSHPATVKGRDPKTDLALLKIEAGKPLPFVGFGNSDQARVGDWVIAVGNPFGLGGTVTAGIVSAHGRNLDAGPYDDFLQIDAPINPGNSGGPLFNQSGQVIGIDTAIYSPTGGSVGIGFAIPSNLAGKVIAQLREHGSVERGWLGLQMQPMTPALAKAMGRPNAEGVLVAEVEPGSPAAQAKLQTGDLVTHLGDTPVKTPRDLARAVADRKAGETVKLSLWREGAATTAEVTIGKQAGERVAASQAQPAGGPKVGLALAPLTQENRPALGVAPELHGAVVAQVVPGSRADASGLKAKDVIVKVGSTAVTSPAEAVERIQAAQKEHKQAVPVLIVRAGKTYYLALELEAA